MGVVWCVLGITRMDNHRYHSIYPPSLPFISLDNSLGFLYSKKKIIKKSYHENLSNDLRDWNLPLWEQS